METEGTTQEKATLGQPADKNNQVRQAIIQPSNVWHGASYESLQPRGKKTIIKWRKWSASPELTAVCASESLFLPTMHYRYVLEIAYLEEREIKLK